MYTTNNGSAPGNGAAASSDSFGAYTYPRARNDSGGSITRPQGMMAADAFANPEFKPAGVWPVEKTAEVPTTYVHPSAPPQNESNMSVDPYTYAYPCSPQQGGIYPPPPPPPSEPYPYPEPPPPAYSYGYDSKA